MDNLNDNALLDMAKYVEQMERYEDMVTYIKAYTLRKKKLDSDERNLLSVAFKNVVGARRSAWRTISNIEQKAEDVALPIKYKEAIEAELLEKCSEVLSLVDECLLPNCGLVDETVFYCKMKGDYYRYLAEIKPIGTPERDEYIDSSKSAYNSAIDSAKELSTTNPIRLGLSLNVSVFYYEIMSNPVKACKLAKEAFDAAIAELDNLKEDSYKDSTLIMQLLRDNLTLWTSESMNVNDNSEEDNN